MDREPVGGAATVIVPAPMAAAAPVPAVVVADVAAAVAQFSLNPAAPALAPTPSSSSDLDDLPPNWEVRVDARGRKYYVGAFSSRPPSCCI